jgi:SAM-dependent methyltransferase
MPESDPSLFYTGLVAELYGALRSVTPDPEPYARFVARWGEPALEVGCGDGDPLLDLRSRGLDVEGLDSSPDMLARCRRAAAARDLDVVLHEQEMQAMALDRLYRSIYIAGPTFNLLPDDEAAASALDAIRRHLEADGAALIPLMIPAPTPDDVLGQPRVHMHDDGTEMRVTPVAETRDEAARCQTTTLRYERVAKTETVAEERPWILHWHTQAGFRELAARAGLDIRTLVTPTGSPAAPEDRAFVAVLV